MRPPLISIITPTYQHEPYIGACVDSVLSQSFTEWEMIVVDDGSLDKTMEIASGYKDSRIRCFRQDHKGALALGETYNFALKQSTGDFVAVLEGDDWWPPDSLKKKLSAFTSDEVVLVHGNTIWNYSSSPANGKTKDLLCRWKDQYPPGILNNDPAGEALKALLCAENVIYSNTVMIRRAALEKVGGFWEGGTLPLVDLPTWLELALVGKFAYVDDVLGYWRKHPANITMSRGQQEIYGRGVEQCINDFIERNRVALMALPLDLAGRTYSKRKPNSWIEPILHSADIYLELKDYITAEKLYRECKPYADSSVQKIWIALGLASCSIHLNLCRYPKYFYRFRKLFVA